MMMMMMMMMMVMIMMMMMVMMMVMMMIGDNLLLRSLSVSSDQIICLWMRGYIQTHALGDSIGETISSSGGFSSVSSRKCASP
jgi:hypothetical protein